MCEVEIFWTIWGTVASGVAAYVVWDLAKAWRDYHV